MKKYRCSVCNSLKYFQTKEMFDDRFGSVGKHYVRFCLACGYGKTFPGLSKAKISSYYEQYYTTAKPDIISIIRQIYIPSRFIGWWSGNNSNPYLSTRKGEKVLDVGFGAGVSLLSIRKLGGKPYGIEPDPSVTRICKTLKVPYHIGFLTNNVFPRILFNRITAGQVLEHVPDPLGFLKAAHKKLTPKGEVVISIPNSNAITRLVFRERWLHWHVPYHLNFFTPLAIIKLANMANFSVKSIRTITPTKWLTWQVLMCMESPIEGVPSNMWGKIGSGRIGGESTLQRRVIFAITLIFEQIITPLLRIIDFIGYGDCIVIKLVKR